MSLGLTARLSAAAKIPEYWVVDLQTEKLVVHLEPKKGEYQRVHCFGKGREVTSSVAPKVTLEGCSEGNRQGEVGTGCGAFFDLRFFGSHDSKSALNRAWLSARRRAP